MEFDRLVVVDCRVGSVGSGDLWQLPATASRLQQQLTITWKFVED
jgi:hypothetical protein